jgi:hypothetical protein
MLLAHLVLFLSQPGYQPFLHRALVHLVENAI